MKEEMTYTKAVAELELILKELENTEEINMDSISARVKRATELMDYCRKQLFELDRELEKMIEELK